MADGVGNAFRFNLLGVPILLIFWRGFLIRLDGVELCVGDLVNGGFDRLDFAHALLNGNAAFNRREESLCTARNVLKGNRDGRFLLERIEERLVVLDGAFQLIDDDVRKLLAVRLGNIKDTHHLEGRTQNLNCFCDSLPICADHRLLRRGVNLLTLFLRLVRRGCKNLDALFALHDLTVKVALPRGITGNIGCLRLLHRNEQRVVEGIVVELGHRAEIFLEPLGFKKLLDALFQLVRDFADLLCIFVFSHLKPPFLICFWAKKTPSGICSVNEPLPQTGFLCASSDDGRCYPRSPIQSAGQTYPGAL